MHLEMLSILVIYDIETPIKKRKQRSRSMYLAILITLFIPVCVNNISGSLCLLFVSGLEESISFNKTEKYFSAATRKQISVATHLEILKIVSIFLATNKSRIQKEKPDGVSIKPYSLRKCKYIIFVKRLIKNQFFNF